MNGTTAERSRIATAYAARQTTVDQYCPLDPWVLRAHQAYERALVRALRPMAPLRDKTVLEVGCGWGSNLLHLMQLGCEPLYVNGFDILPDRITEARHKTPHDVAAWTGDATDVTEYSTTRCDIILQSTMLSSVLDPAIRSRIASNMWSWLKPGGVIISYDFWIKKPWNDDVVGIGLSEIHRLFPQGDLDWQQVSGWMPGLPTHLMCAIRKI